jgi:hypothetical protein
VFASSNVQQLSFTGNTVYYWAQLCSVIQSTVSPLLLLQGTSLSPLYLVFRSRIYMDFKIPVIQRSPRVSRSTYFLFNPHFLLPPLAKLTVINIRVTALNRTLLMVIKQNTIHLIILLHHSSLITHSLGSLSCIIIFRIRSLSPRSPGCATLSK